MTVCLNQGQRSLYQVRVQALTFHLPDGYSKQLSYVGSGQFGSVVRTKGTTSRVNGNGQRVEINVAIKMCGARHDAKSAQLCYRELKLLQHLDHENIARIVDLYTPARNAVELDKIYLVMEYVGSSLDKLLQESIKDPQHHVYVKMTSIPRIVRDTLRALKYLEAANVLHRDLKPSNLGIHSSGKAVLIDFGLGRTGRKLDKSSALTDGVGTPSYAAPEVTFWTGGSYDRQADIWSLGCILAEMLSWEPLFKNNKSKVSLSVSLFGPISTEFSEKVSDPYLKSYMKAENEKRIASEEQRQAVEEQVDLAALKEYFSTRCRVADLNKPEHEAALDFLRECLQYDPETRISIDQALHHPFLADIFVQEDLSRVQPLLYDDSDRSIDDWKCVLFSQIINFQARGDTPRP